MKQLAVFEQIRPCLIMSSMLLMDNALPLEPTEETCKLRCRCNADGTHATGLRVAFRKRW